MSPATWWTSQDKPSTKDMDPGSAPKNPKDCIADLNAASKKKREKDGEK